jgi:transposase
MEIAGTNIVTKTMDHHGLVASICKDLCIAERIDKILYQEDTGRVVTPGEAVIAMIINGLGFTNRRLYLMDQFFENKPIDKLIAPGLTASDITYDTLASALDDIHNYGETQLYGELALDIALEHKLLGHLNHLDTTSISVEGNYDVPDDPGTLRITHGHSKDKRPDLKQLMVSLVVTGESHFPLWMETLDGNSSDKANLHETIAKVRAFQAQLNDSGGAKWVADSALYTKDKLLQASDYLWLSRVPETIGEARRLVEKAASDVSWTDRDNGYQTADYESDFGGIKQRWLLVYSEQAYKRETNTLNKRLEKLEKKYRAEIKALGARIFGCAEDAEKALKAWKKGKRFFRLSGGVEPVEKHQGRGRPKVGAEKILVGYRLAISLERDGESIEIEANKKGRFILATNDLDKNVYPDELMLSDYKNQQAVERGFRFLKDPWFMLDSVFLKKPERVSALMMVMTLCLMVYNLAEYRLRESLKRNNATLPNQKGKEVTNPTIRWVFQLLEGIHIIQSMDQHGEPERALITNIDALRSKIIHLFGQTACKTYGLIPEMPDAPLRM